MSRSHLAGNALILFWIIGFVVWPEARVAIAAWASCFIALGLFQLFKSKRARNVNADI